MIKAIKIRLKPTREQEILMCKSTGIARFTYNWGLARWEEMYAEDLNTAYQNFFQGRLERPKFKSKRKSRKSFYVRYDRIKFKNGRVSIEKIGKVQYTTNYNIPILDKYVNPRCYFDGKYWYLTLGFEHNENQVELNKDLSIGIDLGIKDLAIINCLDNPVKNINKSSKVRKIKLFYRKLRNIRDNHIHQATNMIVKLKPYRVVMKNKHLSKVIQEQKFYKFIRQMKYKCQFNGIEFIQVSRFYPSSKTCSVCGSIKKDLKLSDRVYKCDKCDLLIDRDKNASINLSRYKSA